MAKDFLTYDQQIDKLVNEKGLVVSDRGYAIEILKTHELLRPREWLQATSQGSNDPQVQARHRVCRYRRAIRVRCSSS